MIDWLDSLSNLLFLAIIILAVPYIVHIFREIRKEMRQDKKKGER